MQEKVKRKNLRRKTLQNILLYAIVVLIFMIFLNNNLKYKITVFYVDGNEKKCQLFYDIGEGYSEGNSQLSTVENNKVLFKLDRNTLKKIVSLRLDPSSSKDDNIRISKITFSLGNYQIWCMTAYTIENYISDTVNLNAISFQDDCIETISANEDPIIYFKPELQEKMKEQTNYIMIKQWLFVTFIYLLLLLF